MNPQEWQEQQQEMRRAFVGHLIERVSRDPYPSSTMLDLIEQSMGLEEVEQYAQTLLDKISQDQFPSLDLMNRIRALL
jgi:hypothetical protein